MMKFSLFFNNNVQDMKTNPSTCKWPAVKLIKIISFRSKHNMIKNDTSSCMQSKCFLEASKDYGDEFIEMAVKALRSKRLSFQPGNTSSILDTAKFEFKNCEALAMESEDPYKDFRNSMEEMVKAYGIKHWEHLEELLALYLRKNRKKNHGLIVWAFVDIFAANSFCNDAASSSSKMHNVGIEEEN